MRHETAHSSVHAAVILFLMAVVIIAIQYTFELEQETLPDFGEIRSVDARRAAFFGYLAQLVAAENRRILGQRERLTCCGSGYRLKSGDWPLMHPILYSGLDERRKDGDDYPARVYVVAQRWPAFRSRAINYVWASSLAQGES